MCLVLVVFALAGCSERLDKNKVELKLAELKGLPKGKLEKLPAPPKKIALEYNLGDKRDPFSPNRTITAPAEEAGPLSPLEEWDIAQLSFRGVMQKGKQVQALIITPNNQLLTATLGSKIGKNSGEIIYLDSQSLTLKEYIPQGNQLFEQERTLYISN